MAVFACLPCISLCVCVSLRLPANASLPSPCPCLCPCLGLYPPLSLSLSVSASLSFCRFSLSRGQAVMVPTSSCSMCQRQSFKSSTGGDCLQRVQALACDRQNKPDNLSPKEVAPTRGQQACQLEGTVMRWLLSRGSFLRKLEGPLPPPNNKSARVKG